MLAAHLHITLVPFVVHIHRLCVHKPRPDPGPVALLPICPTGCRSVDVRGSRVPSYLFQQSSAAHPYIEHLSMIFEKFSRKNGNILWKLPQTFYENVFGIVQWFVLRSWAYHLIPKPPTQLSPITHRQGSMVFPVRDFEIISNLLHGYQINWKVSHYQLVFFLFQFSTLTSTPTFMCYGAAFVSYEINTFCLKFKKVVRNSKGYVGSSTGPGEARCSSFGWINILTQAPAHVHGKRYYYLLR